jgi:hypothetical protein
LRRRSLIIKEAGQSNDEALDAYGRDRIGPNDRIVIWSIVDPPPVV